MYQLVITENAELHAFEAALYYEEQQEGLGERFLSAFESVFSRLTTHPEYYSFISTQKVFRDIVLRGFPYVVIYQIDQKDVVVIDVFHTSRNPVV